MFDPADVERLLHIARDRTLGDSFSERVAAVTEQLEPLLPSSALSVIVLDLDRRAATPPGEIFYKNGDVANLVPYTAHYIRHDPMLPAIPLADGRSHLLSDFLPDRRFGRDEFTADYLPLINVRHIMGCSHHMPSGELLSIAIHREKRLADFTEKERTVLRLVAPDLVRAAWGGLLAERVARIRGSGEREGRVGVVVFDPRGEVAETDETGAELAAAIERSTSAKRSPLRRCVEELAATATSEGTQRELTAGLPDGRWVRARLSSLTAGPGTHVIAVLHVLAPGSDELRERLLEQGGLTARERDAALLAARGLGNREIARRLGVKEATVNTHLQRVYVKMRVLGRTELTAFLLGGKR